MLRRLLPPIAIALVAACSGGGSGTRTDGGTQPVNWGHRNGIWAACYFIDKGQCLDFLDPEDTSTSAQQQSNCVEEEGLWYEVGTCPETQLGSCEMTLTKMVLRYYRSIDVSKGKMACSYSSGTWSEP